MTRTSVRGRGVSPARQPGHARRARCPGAIAAASAVLALLAAVPAKGLILVQEGNAPAHDPGWPTGAAAVANLPSRLGYTEGPPFGGGEYCFTYQCRDTAEFNDALRLFGAIRVPRPSIASLRSLDGDLTLDSGVSTPMLVVHDGPRPAGLIGGSGEPKRVDWTFTVWVPQSYYRLFSDPDVTFDSDHPNFRQPMPAPRLDLYAGSGGPIEWAQVEVPASVRVIDHRARPGAAAAGGAVRGSVFAMETHQVIAGAVVSVIADPPQGTAPAATTDARGMFALDAIPPGIYDVQAAADGFVTRRLGPFDNRDGHATLDLDLLLARAGSLSGRVTDPRGQPLADVPVVAEGTIGIDGLGYRCAAAPATRTGADGSFALEPLPHGCARLICRAPDLHQQTSILTLYHVTVAPHPAPEQIAIVLTGTGSLRGRVTDPQGAAPTRSFLVEIEPAGGARRGSWGGSLTCQADGSFELRGIPPGDYVVVAQPNPMQQGEATPPRTVTIAAGQALELTLVSGAAHAPPGR